MNILKEGDSAPNFKGLDENGNNVELSDFSNKKLQNYSANKDQRVF